MKIKTKKQQMKQTPNKQKMQQNPHSLLNLFEKQIIQRLDFQKCWNCKVTSFLGLIFITCSRFLAIFFPENDSEIFNDISATQV